MLKQLEAEHAKLLQAHYARSMTLGAFGTEQTCTATSKQHTTDTLTNTKQGFDDVAVKLVQALDLVRNWRELYEDAPTQLRRKLNHSSLSVYIFKRLMSWLQQMAHNWLIHFQQ